ncbi:MAG: domain S-box protein [Flaviaesturariibacter sp.]|nr:domain S-box protein [Flaviaesturariibacter sp.]
MGEGNVSYKTKEELEAELEEVRYRLEEANETIEAIRTGQVDALVMQSETGHQLYTLKSADQTYRVFIEKMTEGAVTLNREGVILYCNSQFARMVAQPLSQVIGIYFENFIAPDKKSDYESLFQKCWTSDCKGEVVLLAGESNTPVQLSLTTLELDEGVSLSIILTDLTSQKAAQQELQLTIEQLAEMNKALESSNNDLQQFASVASHDLQEPLRKIQIFSSLLKEKQTQITPESAVYLEKIIDSSSRMKSLIVDILNYSRLSAADHLIECVDIGILVKELLEDFELVIQDKSAVIDIGELPCLDANRGQIRQVFQNIISNALKFSIPDTPPHITIHSQRMALKAFDAVEDSKGAFCQITIRDNGIGFDEKYVRNIFALFERLNSKDKYEGTGIGLAIAKKIIDKHHGLLTATSEPGQGATFKIVLPMTQEEVGS